MAIQGNEIAAQNRLTISVKVKFTNAIEPKQSFEKSFTQYENFSSTENFTSVESDLVQISADNFTELTQNKILTSDNIQGLKELVDKYPYFQSARVLYLKSLLDTESGEYKTEVTTNAPLVPSRRHLPQFRVR